MPSLTALPTEIIQLIFKELQDVTSGPRYSLIPPAIDIVHTRIEDRPANVQPEDLHGSWKLTDPGPLHLGRCCKALQHVYLSDAVAGNLILEIPDPILPAEDYGRAHRPWVSEPMQLSTPVSLEPPPHLRPSLPLSARDQPYEWWRMKEHNGNLLQRLKTMKRAQYSKRLIRFMLDSKWAADTQDNWNTIGMILGDIFKDVSEVFGDELMIAICCQGLDVQKDFRSFAPWDVKRLERMCLNLRSSAKTPKFPSAVSNPVRQLEETPLISATRLRNGRSVTSRLNQPATATEVDTSTSAPLSLHLYFGYGQRHADVIMGDILAVLANKNLTSLHFCSDPNNFRLVGHSRRPAQGRSLHVQQNRGSFSNPWRFLLPQISSAHETLKHIRLDCSLFWSEIAYVLPYLHELETLDCSLTLLHTEPMFPMELESKEEARRRILDTCLNSEINMQKERSLKKNKNKKWISISKEDIGLPVIEPVVKEMPLAPHSRWHTVDMRTCLQFMKELIIRAERDK